MITRSRRSRLSVSSPVACVDCPFGSGASMYSLERGRWYTPLSVILTVRRTREIANSGYADRCYIPPILVPYHVRTMVYRTTAHGGKMRRSLSRLPRISSAF